jgi:hypothetical protein
MGEGLGGGDHPPLNPLPSTPEADLRQGRGNELLDPPLVDKPRLYQKETSFKPEDAASYFNKYFRNILYTQYNQPILQVNVSPSKDDSSFRFLN